MAVILLGIMVSAIYIQVTDSLGIIEALASDVWNRVGVIIVGVVLVAFYIIELFNDELSYLQVLHHAGMATKKKKKTEIVSALKLY